MISSVERIKIWGAVRFGWSRPGRKLDAIRGFEATEADGVWHLRRAIDAIDDSELKAIVFTHSLEEEAHAEEFNRVFKESSPVGKSAPRYERKVLYGPDEPAWKSFAFVHVGEVDATDRFRRIQSNLDDGPLRDALKTIVDDEEGHIDLTHDLLLRMGATEPEIKREVRRVRLIRAWEGWLRSGKRITDVLVSFQLSIVYYLFGLLLFFSARRKLQEKIVVHDNNHLKRMR